jgi:RNA polymerase sigma factor (sigma-70 family)
MANANRGVVYQQIDRLYRDGTLSGLSDSQLLDRYLTLGDDAAFEAIVNRHGPMVLGLCKRVLRDPRDIEDAFQASFLILVRKAPSIRDRGRLSNWLFGVAYRVARRARTNTLRRRDREVAVANFDAPSTPETAVVGEELDQELGRLPRKYRMPLILCYLEGHTHDQAAEELACPVGTVRSRLARGRDLLRRRLTTRGYVPTAAALGEGAAVPTTLITEAVPPSLVAATVQAALAISASKTLQAGAASASALALAQGVLTTMKFAQWKLVGSIILATSVSAGSVVAVSYAARQNPKDVRDANANQVTPAKDAEQSDARTAVGSTTKASAAVEKRLRSLEAKLDEILSRSNPVAAPAGNASSNSDDPRRRRRGATAGDGDARPNQSIQELEVDLKLAIAEDQRIEQLYKHSAISASEREQARGKVLLVKAVLQARDDELADEIERLRLEIKTTQAAREKTKAQTGVASSAVARNTRLNERKAGMVSAEDVAKAEWELKVASAQVAMVEAEIAEIELRVRQLERRRAKIREIIDSIR